MIVWEINSKNFETVVKKAALALQKSKVLACPTDTVYGLIADAANKKAVKKVLLIKGRKKTKPLPIFVNSIAMAKRLARVSPSQGRFLKKVWPGKVTLILESRGLLAQETGTQESIGLRIPKHKLVQLILQKVKTPLTGTSANLSGEPPLRDSKEILRQFQNRTYKPDILLDAGNLPFSLPSKVVDITQSKPKVLRK
jgi:L-threonylcarbamoyladenylate synthase